MSSPSERADLADVAGRFALLLQRAGLTVGPERAGRFAAAVALAAPTTTPELYWCARVTLVSEPSEIAVFDAVFSQVFGGLVDPADHRGQTPSAPVPSLAAGTPAPAAARGTASAPAAQGARRGERPPTGTPADDTDGPVATSPVSDRELLRRRDFGTCTPEELEHIRTMLREVILDPPHRPSRRSHRHRSGTTVDLGGTIAAARRTGGDTARLHRRRRRTRPRRLVLLADVSGSMEPYARTYLTVLHGSVRTVRAEAFVFATRLTRLTRHLAHADPQVALTRAMADADDWAGGTRIGAALKAFNDGWGRRGLARGAVVVIVSDGWEAGDPALLGQELERLSRLAYRIVWVNPRKHRPGYEPLVGGMAAALPHVDAFVSGHSVEGLAELVEALHA